MMDFPLTLAAILHRAETLFPEREIVSLAGDAPARRVGYAELARRARRAAAGMSALGVGPADRVGTLCMSHQAHPEPYLRLPQPGAIPHYPTPRPPTAGPPS